MRTTGRTPYVTLLPQALDAPALHLLLLGAFAHLQGDVASRCPDLRAWLTPADAARAG